MSRKPCPFCNDTDNGVSDGVVHCIGCGATANVEDWDKRPIEDELNDRCREITNVQVEIGEENVILKKRLERAQKDLVESEKDARYAVREAERKARWKAQQGDEYGSY